MRYAFPFLCAAMLATMMTTVNARDTAEDKEFAQRAASGPPPQTMRINDIMIEHYRLPEGQAEGHEFLMIHQGQEAPLRLVDHRFIMRQLHAGPGGGANLVFRGSSSEGSCCYTAYIVWLGGGMHVESVKLGASDFDVPSWSNGAPRIRFHDTAFAGWKADAAESPAPQVVLHLDIDAYVADIEAMRQPAPDAAALAALAEPIRLIYQGLPEGQLAPVLWGKMLDLIYSGNAAAARRLLDLAWPERRPGKAEFLAAFTGRLHDGEIWRRFDLGKLLDADTVFPPGLPL